MATDSCQKEIIGVSVLFAIAGVGLIVASFATDHWIESHPKKTNGTTGNISSATITFGLFSGHKSINFALGLRVYSTKLECDTEEHACAFMAQGNLDGAETLKDLIKVMKNGTKGGSLSLDEAGLFDFRLFVATLVFLCLTIASGLVTIGFSIFNIFGRPIETITGRSGLYLWNLLALIMDVIAIGIYLGLYFTQLKENILLPSEHRSGFSSKDYTDLDYSFYFIVGAAGAFLINIILLAAASRRCSCSYSGSAEKEMDNGMILY